jgi:hypothetical protein
MTKAEMARALGVSKAAVTKLTARGMPISSLQAANEWRGANCRTRKDAPRPKDIPAPALPPADDDPSVPPAVPQPDPVAEAAESDPRDSVKTARLAEKIAWKRLADATKRPETSDEEYRRINAAYIAARQNRMKAESDYRDWKRQEGITLFLSEAQEICARPHQATAQMLAVMPKQLAPRLHNQPVREIERTLAEWCDGLAEVVRAGI